MKNSKVLSLLTAGALLVSSFSGLAMDGGRAQAAGLAEKLISSATATKYDFLDPAAFNTGVFVNGKYYYDAVAGLAGAQALTGAAIQGAGYDWTGGGAETAVRWGIYSSTSGLTDANRENMIGAAKASTDLTTATFAYPAGGNGMSITVKDLKVGDFYFAASPFADNSGSNGYTDYVVISPWWGDAINEANTATAGGTAHATGAGNVGVAAQNAYDVDSAADATNSLQFTANPAVAAALGNDQELVWTISGAGFAIDTAYAGITETVGDTLDVVTEGAVTATGTGTLTVTLSVRDSSSVTVIDKDTVTVTFSTGVADASNYIASVGTMAPGGSIVVYADEAAMTADSVNANPAIAAAGTAALANYNRVENNLGIYSWVVDGKWANSFSVTPSDDTLSATIVNVTDVDRVEYVDVILYYKANSTSAVQQGQKLRLTVAKKKTFSSFTVKNSRDAQDVAGGKIVLRSTAAREDEIDLVAEAKQDGLTGIKYTFSWLEDPTTDSFTDGNNVFHADTMNTVQKINKFEITTTAGGWIEEKEYTLFVTAESGDYTQTKSVTILLTNGGYELTVTPREVNHGDGLNNGTGVYTAKVPRDGSKAVELTASISSRYDDDFDGSKLYYVWRIADQKSITLIGNSLSGDTADGQTIHVKASGEAVVDNVALNVLVFEDEAKAKRATFDTINAQASSFVTQSGWRNTIVVIDDKNVELSMDKTDFVIGTDKKAAATIKATVTDAGVVKDITKQDDTRYEIYTVDDWTNNGGTVNLEDVDFRVKKGTDQFDILTTSIAAAGTYVLVVRDNSTTGNSGTVLFNLRNADGLKATGITLDQSVVTITNRNEAAYVYATVEPFVAQYQRKSAEISAVKWSIADTKVAVVGPVVDGAGKNLTASEIRRRQNTDRVISAENWAEEYSTNGVSIAAIGEGTTTLTATTVDGGFVATVTINVTSDAAKGGEEEPEKEHKAGEPVKEDGVVGYLNEDLKTVTVTDVTVADKAITIPATVDGFTVSTIDAQAFKKSNAKT